MFDRRESVTLFGVKVYVRNKKAGFKVGGYKRRGGGAVYGYKCGGKVVYAYTVEVGSVSYNGALSDGTEGYAYTDFVVRKSDKRDRKTCLLYTSPSPRDGLLSRMPSSA